MKTGSRDVIQAAACARPGEPVRTVVRPKDRRPRPKRWADAVRTLQAEYEAWRDQLPESLADSRTAELPEGVCDVDLDALDCRPATGLRPRLERPRRPNDTHMPGSWRIRPDADFTPAQTDALTDALRLVVEQGEHVTSDRFKGDTGGR